VQLHLSNINTLHEENLGTMLVRFQHSLIVKVAEPAKALGLRRRCLDSNVPSRFETLAHQVAWRLG
jgi:hypothetical protein